MFVVATILGIAAGDVSDPIRTNSSASVQPAVDLITRNFGPGASAVFQLKLLDEGVGCETRNEAGETTATAKAPCFAITQNAGVLVVSASSMSELTYGIGYYARYTCGS